jgi:hypothetical protein
MLDIPEFQTLLHSEVLCDDLPRPGLVCLEPLNLKDVHLAHYEDYAMKLNAALKASSAQSSLQMRDNHGGNPLIPDFLSSPSNDQQQTTSGNTHVVGILLCHDQWNSGMRNHNAIEQVKYLLGLARLQHALREHGTRYGFIITEIELVCVRYGGDDVVAQQCVPEYTFSHTTSSAFIPIFGYFEVSPATPLSDNYKYPDRDLKMTAGLALWYLHMQARGKHGKRVCKLSTRIPTVNPCGGAKTHDASVSEDLLAVYRPKRQELVVTTDLAIVQRMGRLSDEENRV